MHPLTLPIWLAGLWFFFFSASGKPFRALGWAWVFAAGVIVTLSPRIYYLFPAFPILFAAGAVAWEAQAQLAHLMRELRQPVLVARHRRVLAPFAIPLLPPETYIRYAKALHFGPPPIETHELGPLPQLFADRFGWEEMTATVARRL